MDNHTHRRGGRDVEVAHQSAEHTSAGSTGSSKHNAVLGGNAKKRCGGGRPAWVEEHLKSDDARARVNAFKTKIEIG